MQFLETRINAIFEFVFGLDAAVHEAWVGLYREGYSHEANLVGWSKERHVQEPARALI